MGGRKRQESHSYHVETAMKSADSVFLGDLHDAAGKASISAGPKRCGLHVQCLDLDTTLTKSTSTFLILWNNTKDITFMIVHVAL